MDCNTTPARERLIFLYIHTPASLVNHWRVLHTLGRQADLPDLPVTLCSESAVKRSGEVEEKGRKEEKQVASVFTFVLFYFLSIFTTI